MLKNTSDSSVIGGRHANIAAKETELPLVLTYPLKVTSLNLMTMLRPQFSFPEMIRSTYQTLPTWQLGSVWLQRVHQQRASQVQPLLKVTLSCLTSKNHQDGLKSRTRRQFMWSEHTGQLHSIRYAYQHQLTSPKLALNVYHYP